MKTRVQVCIVSLLAMVFTFSVGQISTFAADDDIICKEGDVCRQKATFLPLRALPRALSNIFDEPKEGAKVTASNVKAFFPLYVFERKDIDLSDAANPKGWYRIGSSVSDPIGWMQARDILEWKQALVVSYTHPGTGDERRNPVIMYDSLDKLKKLVESDKRKEDAKTVYEGLKATPVKVPDGVVTAEPQRFVDIEEKFYVLPVLKFEEVDIFDEETRYLQLAAAIPKERGDEDSPDTLKNKKFAEQAAQKETTQGTDAKNLGVDIKFVLDVTGSMGPYIERTKKAIMRVATEVSKIDTRVSYGLIGYSDQFKNLTPELVDETGFEQVISGITAAGGGDHQEEVFAGVREAIQSDWNENTFRVMIIVGDASSHPMGHPMNLTGMGEEELRIQADQNNIMVFAIHLKDPRTSPDHPVAETQLRMLGKNPGAQIESYIPIKADDVDEFEKSVKTLAGTLSGIIGDIRKGKTTVEEKTVEKFTEAGSEASEKTAEMVKDAVDAALVRYLGAAASPPKDITAWVLDRDIAEPDIRSLEVRVLVKKRDLNDLIQALDQVLKAVKRSELTSQKFFDALQGVVASSTKGEKVDFSTAEKLADSGLMPSWIASLPYKSAILNMTNEIFESISADERAKLETDVESKLNLYRDVNENTSLWIALDERDAKIDHVYPLSLDALP